MKRVLVVEDDAVYREALARALTRSGYATVPAASVAEAEQCAADDPPDLALVDLQLSDGSGIDVVRTLMDEAPACRIVMLSGHGTIRSAVEAMRAGAVDFLTKPVSSTEIAAALEAAERYSPPKRATTDLDSVEREHILGTLEAAGGNITEAARLLGLHRRTLQRKLNKIL